MTPTARTLALLRRSHYVAGVVERWIPRANVRKDLFGVIDIVAIRRGETGVLGIQATSMANVSARVAKAKTKGELRTWLACGNRFEVWGWRGREVKRVALTGDDLAAAVMAVPRRRRRADEQRELFA